MAAAERWYFTKEQLALTPSRKCGLDADKELSYRQQAANLIQDMGQRLQVTQLCINTAIVYMHRFYYYHSFTKFHRNSIAACALFLAAKVEEQPRKLEHVIKVAHMCLHRDAPPLNPASEAYQEQALELVLNENMMLQTLGFDIGIEHPHTHVVNFCQLVRASKDLAQTSYFMATNSLHLTMMCLQYKPRVVACLCIHLACKWSNWEVSGFAARLLPVIMMIAQGPRQVSVAGQFCRACVALCRYPSPARTRTGSGTSTRAALRSCSKS
uniref:Cyclin T n=1 Tax=Rhipicephalus zambeziensis TaxID=60191 RepID=A0A224YV20_9ACAR